MAGKEETEAAITKAQEALERSFGKIQSDSVTTRALKRFLKLAPKDGNAIQSIEREKRSRRRCPKRSSLIHQVIFEEMHFLKKIFGRA